MSQSKGGSPGRDALVRAVKELSSIKVRMPNWEDFIECRSPRLVEEVMTADEAGRQGFARMRAGRFNTMQVAIADAVFSKQKKYRVAVQNHVQPFAREWGAMTLAEFCKQPWPTVFERSLRQPAKDPNAAKHNHLSLEGRVRTIMAGAKRTHDLGVRSVEDALAWSKEDARRARLRGVLLSTQGLGEALVTNILMNVGYLRPKLDTHVREVVSSCCGIPKEAPAEDMYQWLDAAASVLGRDAFELDQIIWYARAEPA